MFPLRQSIKQIKISRALKETLPTMYDLPSEDPEEPGLPDEYHYLQPQLLSLTFRPPNYPTNQIFSAGDLNIYYDISHTNWYKRPDWFGVVGISRLYDQRDLRLSYVIWQEEVTPCVVVELLSPGTEDEDLGENKERLVNQPPSKWEVYEQILQVPYYILFDRYTDLLRAFTITSSGYQELDLLESRIWMPNLQLGLGLWQGNYQGIERQWLRWYDDRGNWVATDAERERYRADVAESLLEQERQRAEQLAERLRSLGIDPNEVLLSFQSISSPTLLTSVNVD